MRVRSLGWEDPLKEEMATHSSILAYRFLGVVFPCHGSLVIYDQQQNEVSWNTGPLLSSP